MNVLSENSRLFTEAELHPSTPMRECTAIIHNLTEKLTPNPRVYRFQLILMKLPNLHKVWTAGKSPALPNTLSRNTQPELITRKTTSKVPQNIKFFPCKRRNITTIRM